MLDTVDSVEIETWLGVGIEKHDTMYLSLLQYFINIGYKECSLHTVFIYETSCGVYSIKSPNLIHRCMCIRNELAKMTALELSVLPQAELSIHTQQNVQHA